MRKRWTRAARPTPETLGGWIRVKPDNYVEFAGRIEPGMFVFPHGFTYRLGKHSGCIIGVETNRQGVLEDYRDEIVQDMLVLVGEAAAPNRNMEDE